MTRFFIGHILLLDVDHTLDLENFESLKWNTVFSISQIDLNTDHFFPLLYLIGQVFVKYAWGMLAWMPEICPSANYSIELR